MIDLGNTKSNHLQKLFTGTRTNTTFMHAKRQSSGDCASAYFFQESFCFRSGLLQTVSDHFYSAD